MNNLTIRQAVADDIDRWMWLVVQVKESFPGLETASGMAEHKAAVLDFMTRGEALCAEKSGELVGVLLFSRSECVLCFLVVAAGCRRQGIAEKLVVEMMKEMPVGRDVTVTTYCDGVPDGIAARAFYKQFGFREGWLTEEFGTQVQEFVLHR